MEWVAVSDIADLRHVTFDQLEAISLNGATPLAQQIIDTSCSRTNPLKLEVEARCWVVDEIVVQDD